MSCVLHSDSVPMFVVFLVNTCTVLASGVLYTGGGTAVEAGMEAGMGAGRVAGLGTMFSRGVGNGVG